MHTFLRAFFTIATILGVVVLWGLCLGGVTSQAFNQTPGNHADAAATIRPAALTGERLTYTVKWDPPWYMFFLPAMEAGELTLELAGQETFRGQAALKIVVTAHSSGTLARLANMQVEDKFIYYADPTTLCALGGIGSIREGKRRRRLELDYFQEKRQLHFRAFDESVTPPIPRQDVTLTDLPPCIRDPFSAFYYFRSLPLAPGYEKTLNIGNDDKIMAVRARIEKKEEMVNLPTGPCAAWRIDTDALHGGLFREGGQFRVWLATSAPHTPVRFEAKVRLGRIVGVLKSVGKVL